MAEGENSLLRDVIAAINEANTDDSTPWSYGPLKELNLKGVWEGNCERATFGVAMVNFVWTDGDKPDRTNHVILSDHSRDVSAWISRLGTNEFVCANLRKGWVAVRSIIYR